MKKENLTVPELLLEKFPDKTTQIATWKAQHGEIFYFKVGKDKECYLKKPSRQTLSYAAVAAATEPLKYNEIILEECWLAGDDEIKTDTGLFLSISQELPNLVEMVEVEMVKL